MDASVPEELRGKYLAFAKPDSLVSDFTQARSRAQPSNESVTMMLFMPCVLCQCKASRLQLSVLGTSPKAPVGCRGTMVCPEKAGKGFVEEDAELAGRGAPQAAAGVGPDTRAPIAILRLWQRARACGAAAADTGAAAGVTPAVLGAYDVASAALVQGLQSGSWQQAVGWHRRHS